MATVIDARQPEYRTCHVVRRHYQSDEFRNFATISLCLNVHDQMHSFFCMLGRTDERTVATCSGDSSPAPKFLLTTTTRSKDGDVFDP